MRVIFISRKTLIMALVIIGLGIAALSVNFGQVVSVFNPNKLIPIYSVKTEERVCSLTFDSAWGDEDIEEIIKILGVYDVKASFFVSGEFVDKFPESITRLHENGHEILNHSDTHAHMPRLSDSDMQKQITDCADKIEKVTGVRPYLFRPPYGDYNDDVIRVARQLKNEVIQWDVDSLDWKDRGKDDIIKRVRDKTNNGSIILLHTGTKYTSAALLELIEALKQKEFKFMKVSELIYKDNYEIDHTGKQYRLEQETEDNPSKN